MECCSRWLFVVALLVSVTACKQDPPAPPPAPPVVAAVEPEDPPFPEQALPLPAEDAQANAIPAKPPEPPFTGDLPALRTRGVLRVLVETIDERSLPRQGMPRSQDRAILERFAEKHGLTAEFIPVERFDQLIPMLREGRGDVIAADLTVTPERAKELAFTRPLALVSEVLVGKRGASGLPRKPEELAGRTVHVRASSTFAASLATLAKDKARGLVVEPVAESLDSEELAWKVTQGELPLTVVDSHLLAAIETYNPNVEALFTIAEKRALAWGVRLDNPALRGALDAFLIERALTEHHQQLFTGDLDGIRKRGVLRVLTRNSPVTYYLHRGGQAGFDYTMAKLVADALKVRLEILVPPSYEALLSWLKEGRGDMVAAALTVTLERQREVAFSSPYLFVDEVLVQRAGAEKPTTLADLKGRAIHVRRSSSHFATLSALAPGHGFVLVEEPEDQDAETLIERVARGEIPFTVTDSHILAAELVYRDDVEVALTVPGQGTPAGKEGHYGIAFAVRQQSPKLRAFLNGFVKKTYRGTEYNLARRRYFEGRREEAPATTEEAVLAGTISPYDGLVRSYSARYGLDWRLMVAQMFQESRFDPRARSWVGAQGLFQVMPNTGTELGFRKLEDPEQGIHAGVKYMHQLIGRIAPEIPFKQRLRFALASYNAGLGHVLDARRLAQEQGLDPNRWFGHVEKAMLLLEKPHYYRRARHGYCRGSEPVKYVSEIQTRYGNYVAVVQH
ncbi:glutamine ABC transporter substrate-binding protein [Myxococcus stipitatus DSM 14675]|uniref:Glutamine ABC transporter substrate-binding protein n=1 Tax=Myxococcus stipitatus (strain DSM 14675 / JCM 12634 / Mx s8) TaxID=1278073 RepID=L7UD72_MYXSD|nr:transporter substrate-binding domain-containing protein [Myxococcus stipitatus]AGC45825.1 glutamine ABC transporter substrate-binding protein [Myxococcus stipitatus DSM 14675]